MEGIIVINVPWGIKKASMEEWEEGATKFLEKKKKI
jgi:hypothetical protein